MFGIWKTLLISRCLNYLTSNQPIEIYMVFVNFDLFI
jgi:hypothetical protein